MSPVTLILAIEIADKTYGTRASNTVTPNLQLYSLLTPHMDLYSDPMHAIFARVISTILARGG